MQPLNTNGVPVNITIQPIGIDQIKPDPSLEVNVAKQLKLLGEIQFVLGALSMALEAASFGLYTTTYHMSLFFVGYGFWIGAIFILTGIFGILAGRRRSRCHAIVFNIMSIVSASFTFLLFSLSLSSAIICGTSKHFAYVYPTTPSYYTNATRSYDYQYGHYEYVASEYPNAQKAAIAMESLMAIIAIVEAIVAIRSSLTVRKIGNSCGNCSCDGCCPQDQTSSQPSVIICRIGSCFCHCVSYCCLPQNTDLNQLVMNGSGGPLTAESNSEKQQEFGTSAGSDQLQPVVLDNMQPVFYTIDSDQRLMIDDPILQAQGSSDCSNLIG